MSKETITQLKKIGNVFLCIIMILFAIYMVYLISIKISNSIPSINNCLDEEKYYYRIGQGLIFSNKVKTTKNKADGYDWECVKWEYELSGGAMLLGQELSHNKGNLK